MPLHPLVVHAAVVFVPLAALAAIAYGLVSKWRWALRTPTLALSLVAALSTQLAGMTGENLKESSSKYHTSLIENHEMWAGRLTFGVWVLVAVAAAAWWVLPHVTALSGRSHKEARIPALVVPLVVLLPLAGVAVSVLAYLTGDAGAKSVWG